RLLAVQRLFGVRHARHRRDPAGQRRGGAGRDRLVLLAPRLAQVDVHVDQARADDLARGVEGAVGPQVLLRPDPGDAVALDPQVGDLVEVLRRVDHPAVGDAQDGHERDTRVLRAAIVHHRVTGYSIPMTRD